jgi:hypothetical protein
MIKYNATNSFREAWLDTDSSEVERENKETKFLFGGWSWKFGRFFIYPIHFDKRMGIFHTYTHKKGIKQLGLDYGELCIAIGNYTAEFSEFLKNELHRKQSRRLDFEPLKILSSMLKTDRFVNRRSDATFYVDKKPGLIGGAPQVLKIYKHSNIKPITVRWTQAGEASRVTLLGRRLFDHELTLNTIYDPETEEFVYLLSSTLRILYRVAERFRNYPLPFFRAQILRNYPQF